MQCDVAAADLSQLYAKYVHVVKPQMIPLRIFYVPADLQELGQSSTVRVLVLALVCWLN